MGVLNLTPDSFYENSRMGSDRLLRTTLETMMSEGVDIIDLGAYSTRPGATDVSQDEEVKRLKSALSVICKYYPQLLLSVDTFRASTADFVVKHFGVGIINDVGGGTLDKLMFQTMADLKVGYVLMHMQGTPATMHTLCDYKNVVTEVLGDLQKKLHQLHLYGISDVLVDPGFGFAKTCDQNFELLNQLQVFNNLGVPILVGFSRKSMIFKTLEITASEALNGTTVLNTLALSKGAKILRVHDVKAAREAIDLYVKMRRS